MTQKQKKGWKLGHDSFNKMIVWFKDGNVRTMYSIDWKHRYSESTDKALGMARFRKKIKEYGSLAGTVEIYEKATGNLIEKYYQGVAMPLTKTEN